MISKSSERESGQLVLPGEHIAVIEEFIPKDGTYVKDGDIYSDVIGRALLDFLNKHVSVYSLAGRMKIPQIGSVVLGQVTRVKKQSAFVRIYTIDRDRLSGFFTGVLHISDVRSKYVESMFDVCKPADIIRAEVVSKKNGIYHLTTKDKNLGVVYAFCSRCGHMLDKTGKRMRCTGCGKTEKRKAASDYGKGTILKKERTNES